MVPAVSIQDVHKHYGAVRALEGVEFSIAQGEFFGLLGPNGAGKSTLINIMAGLARSTRGEVRIMGHDVVRGYRRARAALGVVPQELAYDPFFTVREVLRLQSGYFGLGPENEAWIDELLHTLALADKARANMHDLSGGMKRRVLIAQALVHRPPVVVLDEPTAGVDVELRRALWDFTQRLHRGGHTIVLTTHYLEEAEALCGRIAILHHGRVKALDSKRALLERYPYRLLCLTVTDGRAALPQALVERVVERADNRLTLRLHKQRDPIGEVLDALHGAGVQVVDLATQDPGLEEIFLQLTAPGESS